jgi:hypothetical protein
MAEKSRATWFLVASIAFTALGILGLLLGGFGFPFVSVLAVVLGLWAYTNGASRRLCLLAVGANVVLVVLLIIGSFLFGGS